jgi:hypothetical protein
MFGPFGRPEYSSLAKCGDWLWSQLIDPILRTIIGNDDTTALLRIRAGIQLTVLAALVLLPISLFWNTAHMLTASGLLFDIAGATRVFLIEEIDNALAGYEVEDENYPSAAMRELIMPEGIVEEKINNNPISFFYYKKRGVLFLFFGFVLQMIADIVG